MTVREIVLTLLIAHLGSTIVVLFCLAGMDIGRAVVGLKARNARIRNERQGRQ